MLGFVLCVLCVGKGLLVPVMLDSSLLACASAKINNAGRELRQDGGGKRGGGHGRHPASGEVKHEIPKTRQDPTPGKIQKPRPAPAQQSRAKEDLGGVTRAAAAPWQKDLGYPCTSSQSRRETGGQFKALDSSQRAICLLKKKVSTQHAQHNTRVAAARPSSSGYATHTRVQQHNIKVK